MTKSKRLTKKNTKIATMVQEAVNIAFTEGFASVLKDIEYRIETLMDVGIGSATGIRQKINSRDLNLASAILDGFAFTDNSPSAGYVAWTGCNMVYKGVNVSITNGNTNKKYIWWQYSATPNNVFQTTDTLPTMTDDDCLIAINTAGVHVMNIGEGRPTHGASIVTGTVGGTQIASGAIGTSNIANNAVTSALIASGAVGTGNIASGAITNALIAANAVQASNIASGAVGSSQIASGAVGSSALASGAVTSTALASGAVTSAAIAANAVTSSAIATGAVGNSALASNAVQSSNIASGAVGSTQIANGAVGSTQIGAGAVASSNLNLAQHLLY